MYIPWWGIVIAAVVTILIFLRIAAEIGSEVESLKDRVEELERRMEESEDEASEYPDPD